VSDETVHRVTLRHVRDFEFSAMFDGVSPERQILLDEHPPLGQGRGPNPAALLAAAIGNCLAHVRVAVPGGYDEMNQTMEALVN
jgi:uncharacterized OsmC-like protein